MNSPKPPLAYEDFIRRYPKLKDAWDNINAAGRVGPLGEKTARLVKLGIAIGALREGAIRSNVRKAKALGISENEIRQVVALAASTVGLPATVAADSWIDKVLKGEKKRPAR